MLLQNYFPLEYSGWEQEDYAELMKQKERSFNLQCANVIENMKRHKQSWPFVDPVNKDDVPDYYDVITDPIGKINLFPFNNRCPNSLN